METAPQTAPPLSEIRLGDPAFFVRPDVDAAFARLRRESPVHRTEDPGLPGLEPGPDFWSVTRHRDVVAVSRDHETFRNSPNMVIEDYARGGDSILHLDPPEHTRLRLLVNKGFTPRMVQRLVDQIRERAAELVVAMAPRGSADLVDDFAVLLPLQVISDLLGVPASDERYILERLSLLFGVADPSIPGAMDARIAALSELGEYAQSLGRQRLEEPREDLTTVLVHAEITDDEGTHRLRPGDYERFFITLAAAGSETTRNAIAWGVLALDAHPDQRAKLFADPDRVMPTAVEEIVRLSCPVMHMRRNAARDTEIAGQPIAEGDKVVIWYRSANRDESVFADPERFDVDRSPNEHVGFGAGGPHFCLGANLARAELRIAVEELFGGLPGLAVAGEPTRLVNRMIAGYTHVPIAWDAR